MVKLVDFDKVFLELSWSWLNDQEIKLLTDTPDFTRKEQEIWFDTLSERDNYAIWGIELDTKPIGVCGLKNITDIDCEKWMYIGEKEYWGRGIGKIIIKLLEGMARDYGKLSLWGKIKKENSRSISNNKKLGYTVESDFKDYIIMRKNL